jgi:hypothetical protein
VNIEASMGELVAVIANRADESRFDRPAQGFRPLLRLARTRAGCIALSGGGSA